MTDPDHAVRWMASEYAAVEHRVRAGMRRHAGPFCAQCARVCCRADICAESRDSEFLQIVRALAPPAIVFDPEKGWRTPEGCALALGRPPVCYEFLCDDILRACPDEPMRYALRVLGMVPTWLGRRALGERHLVTLRDRGMLRKVKPKRFANRLGVARSALERIEACLLGGKRPDAEARTVLGKICRPLRGP